MSKRCQIKSLLGIIFLQIYPNLYRRKRTVEMSKPIDDLDEVLESHKLTKEEYQDILRILDGRHPNIVETGIFSAMWSEHCSYIE